MSWRAGCFSECSRPCWSINLLHCTSIRWGPRWFHRSDRDSVVEPFSPVYSVRIPAMKCRGLKCYRRYPAMKRKVWKCSILLLAAGVTGTLLVPMFRVIPTKGVDSSREVVPLSVQKLGQLLVCCLRFVFSFTLPISLKLFYFLFKCFFSSFLRCFLSLLCRYLLRVLLSSLFCFLLKL